MTTPQQPPTPTPPGTPIQPVDWFRRMPTGGATSYVKALDVDGEAGAWYLRLLDEPVAQTTEQPGPVYVDWTRDGRMVGVELLSSLKRPDEG